MQFLIDILSQFIRWTRSWVTRFKPYLRWLILGSTLFFLIHTLRQHWQEVLDIRIPAGNWAYVAIALLVTLMAHVWAGWVWGWLLEELGYPALGSWSILAYLKTNIAKYLPGNVWHFYGRVMAAKTVGVSLEGAALSVVMEPLLMAIAALIVAFASNQTLNLGLQVAGLLVGLGLVHPRIMNPLLKKLAIAKMQVKIRTVSPEEPGEGLKLPPMPDSLISQPKTMPIRVQAIAPASGQDVQDLQDPAPSSLEVNEALPVPVEPQPPLKFAQLRHYPLIPLLGELGFLLLRGAGFVLAVMVLQPLALGQVPILLSAFSLAWMLGLIVPGAPGGIGVFEATALALLDGSLPSGILLGAVALYRLISTLAEAIGAGAAYLIQPSPHRRRWRHKAKKTR